MIECIPPTDCIAAAERENHRLHSKSDGEKVLGSGVSLLQVDDFRTTAVREVTGKLEVNAEPSTRHEETDYPDDEGKTN